MNQKRDYYLLRCNRGLTFFLTRLLGIGIILGTGFLHAKPKIKGGPMLYEMVQSTVSGTVLDENGLPLPGANIVVKGTTTGTQTDFDGNFTIEASSDAVLIFSYIGYKTQEVSVSAQSTLQVSMELDAAELEGVVVTGYSKQSTRDITGAVTVVGAKELEATAPTSIEQALQGQAAGVTVGSEGGPGGSAAVRIRGFGTVNGNDPLYIIDGTPSNAGLNDLNPNDIESIQILKDASAAAIYGIRAGNGVIIITTKSGKVNQKVQFSANVWTGVSFIPNSVFPNIATPQQHAEALWRAEINTSGNSPNHPQFGNGPTPVLPTYIIPAGSGDPGAEPYNLETNRITRGNAVGTDYFDEFFNSALTTNYSINASGGTENSKSFFSLGLLDQDGVALGTDFFRVSLRANTQFNITNRFRVGENITVSLTDRTGLNGNQDTNGSIAALTRIHPFIPIYDEGGNFAGSGAPGLGNANAPIAQALRFKDNSAQNFRALGNFFAEYDILENLTFKSNMGFDINSFNQSRFFPAAPEGEVVNLTNRLEERSEFNKIYTWFNTLNYDKDFGKHSFNVLAGTEFNNTNRRTIGASRTGFLFNDVLNTRVLDLGTENIANFGFASQVNYFSLFGKVDYKFDDKYLLSATLRRDGSSQFTEGNKYGVFPSFSAGWRVSNESFLQDSEVFTNLLIKAGYGVIGSNASIPADNVADILTPNTEFNAYPSGNGSLDIGYGLQSRGNESLTWETTTTTNVGITTQLFNRIGLDVDAYIATTEDLLVNDPGDATILGSTNVIRKNLGEVENKGIDVNLSYSNSPDNKFTYTIAANVSHYKNEVKFLDPNNLDDFIDGIAFRSQRPNRTIAGQPLAAFWGKKFLGFNDEGRMLFEDINGDGADDAEDRQFIGSPHPDFTYGLNFSANYGNWDMAMLWQGSQGNDIYNFNKFFLDFNTFPGAKSVDYVQENNLPALTTSAEIINRESDQSSFYLEDGSYARMKNIQIGYTLPSQTVEKLGLAGIRFYVQGKNLITITDYSGLDPEISLARFGNENQNLTIGVDGGAYPIDRQVIVGLNVNF